MVLYYHQLANWVENIVCSNISVLIKIVSYRFVSCYFEEKLVIDCIEIYEKNTNLYKTILKNLLKLNVSGEILPLSIVNFVEFEKKEKWKKKLFSLMFRKQP